MKMNLKRPLIKRKNLNNNFSIFLLVLVCTFFSGCNGISEKEEKERDYLNDLLKEYESKPISNFSVDKITPKWN